VVFFLFLFFFGVRRGERGGIPMLVKSHVHNKWGAETGKIQILNRFWRLLGLQL
jgi:hypothetical protein